MSANTSILSENTPAKNPGVSFLAVMVFGSVLVGNALCQTTPNWPDESDWEPLTIGGTYYTDAVSKPPDQGNFQDNINIVGDTNNYAGAFYHDASHVFFRMRVAGDGTGKNNVWQWPIDNDMDSGADGAVDVEYVVEVRQSQSDQVEIAVATVEGTTWNTPPDDVAFSTVTSRVYTPLDDFSRWTNAQTNIGGGTDYFVDAAIPLGDFTSTVVPDFTDFAIALTTSTTHTEVNKDYPDGAMSDPVQTPEPGAALLLVLAACGFLISRSPGAMKKERR